MTLEDSDDDHQPMPHNLQYRRSKSKPLGATTLIVPAGGPGGGVGYGTARSSNDGRPESASNADQSPFYRPPSPSGSMTADDFRKERGRSPRQSPLGASNSNSYSHGRDARSNSAHSAPSPAPHDGKKPVARITAGPKSTLQQQHESLFQLPSQSQPSPQFQQSSRGNSPAAPGPRPTGMAGPRQFPSGGPPPPHHPQSPHFQPQGIPLQHRSPSAGPPTMDQRGFPPMLPPQHDSSRGDSRRFSLGPSTPDRSGKDSNQGAIPPFLPPGAAPLQGLPSPIDIPYGRSPHSPLRFGNGDETDYSRGNSPFGSVSPIKAGASPSSPGFLATLVGRQSGEDRQSHQQRSQDDQVTRSCSPGGGTYLAGKWFKGVFGRSPRADEKEPNYADFNAYPTRDAEDEAAYAQKLASMRQARHIVDQERQRAMMGPTTLVGPGRGAPGAAQRFDPASDREFRPKQVVDSDVESNADDDGLDADLAFELGRKKSPPGRKPVPAYLPGVATGQEVELKTGLPDEPLTPAQKIIQETRSKQMVKQSIEEQRKEAAARQQQQISESSDRPAPATPSKSKQSGQHERFPSGAHPLTREPAQTTSQPQKQPQPQPQQQNGGSTLSPGTGPMPADMPLRDALQEMMARFYRFERYSVPLIRSLETRLLDIERDAMLAHNPPAGMQSMSSEMDRWVGQMTSLMKHEIGQLKAATREIREGRQLVADVARKAPHEGVVQSMTVSSFGSLHAITPSASTQVDAEGPVPRVGAAASPAARNLVLPQAAKPALDKDEGKHMSPTKANFGFASESNKEKQERETASAATRDRSVSPNGRPRYTSVLGQPLVHGRISPSPASPHPDEAAEMKRDISVQNRLKALVDGGASTRSRSSSFASVPEPVPVTKTDSASSSEEAEEPMTPTLTSSPAVAVASGRISPNKLFAHKFSSGFTGSNGSKGLGSGSPSVKLGLVEKKRFTLPAPAPAPAPIFIPTPVPTRTPSGTFEDSKLPTSAAFSGLAKVKPVGHTATLRERVAFFDTAK